MNRSDSLRPRPRPAWRAAAASALVYVAVTAIIGRDVLLHPVSRVLNDPGDPLLNAALLYWNAIHLPLTHGWWQFPIFFPTQDVLTFSEHLLGLSVVATPIEWLFRQPMVAYNTVALLTFPLCGMAMFALVYRLTRSAAGAFVAGVAFAFAPYRVSQLAHVQMLASFYAPIALLGLHEYLGSGRRRWLALYGVCWALQGAANGYLLFYFSVLVGLWGLWFVVAQRRWRALVEIVATTIVAAAPLALVLYRYLVVHEFQGFVRSAMEMRTFSADVANLLCASPSLSLWGSLQVACRPEGQLFPGVATLALFAAAVVYLLGWPRGSGGLAPRRRVLVIAARLVLAVALIYAATVVAIAHAGGPLALDLGPLHASASNMPKAALLSITALVVSLLLGTLARRGEHGPPPMAFYVVAAVVTWSLTLGPSIIVMGSERGVAGPFSWLLTLPGTDALRVPARFWLMTVLCLAVTGGFVVAELVARRRQAVAVAAAVLIGAAVFSDGAVNALVSTPMPRPLPDARVLAGGHVLFLPIGQQRFDIPFTYQAVVGRFSAVNGYSGYEPSYYPALVAATRMEDPALFQPLRRYGPLDVVVVNDAPRLRALIEDVPGARELARDDAVTEYRLPAAPAAYAVASGRIVPIRRLHADCGTGTESRAVDGSLQSAWLCPQIENAAFTIDLGQPAVVGAVVTQMGPWVTGYPRELTVETSLDGERWEAGWSGRALAPLVWSALAQPPIVPMTFAFAPRQARFVRLTQTGRDTLDPWAIAEVQVRAP